MMARELLLAEIKGASGASEAIDMGKRRRYPEE